MGIYEAFETDALALLSCANVQAASTVDLGALGTLRARINGVANITSFGSAANEQVMVEFTSAAVVQHNPPGLRAGGGANLTAVPGQLYLAQSNAAGEWRIGNSLLQAPFIQRVRELLNGFLAARGSLSLDGTQFGGFRNALANPDFSQWPNGPGPFTTDVETAAEWFLTEGAGSVNSVERTAHLSPNHKWGIAWARTTAGTVGSVLETRIPNGARAYGDQAMTLSFDLWALSGTPEIQCYAIANYGTGGLPSAEVLSVPAGLTSTAALQRIKRLITVPPAAGKVFGTNDDDFLRVILHRDEGYANGTLAIGAVQLEPGYAATPFERRSRKIDELLCA